MNKTLENVYVVIYSKKHLKEAIKWLQHYGQDIECDIRHDWENENNYLSINAGSFGLRQINKDGYYEVSLNQLIEMVVDKESEKYSHGDIILKGSFLGSVFNSGIKLHGVDKFADLKKAHAEGAVIEFKDRHGDWQYAPFPSWEEPNEYRIKPEPKATMGDYVVTELKSDSVKGFYAHRIELQESADNLNREDALHNFKVITKEKFEELRKEAFD
ncbi:hypothetical protein ORI89_17515 [Sphingobacterium sp. UT-1RO-CII-1]|uniref:hypothetical protein n=1 Tax=Sphingobacterium sp. UT-1RO-CII-1 TaxID=2995225 RepID=UPI00227C5066|nr:hypothetical protein [Sphingobacterium sp. UT-1RO-CII-1]MCY4781459.1 hypothetical protein [Sphingobacterium sp. UT-1RO-CII-1]